MTPLYPGLNTLRPMRTADIDAVVALIESHDEDDAQEARSAFSAPNGVEDYFVLELEGALIGVCGYRTPPACEQTHWLSWTYIHADHVNQGHGRKMIGEMIDHLKAQGGRKLFVKVSDYAEEGDEGQRVETYAAALHLYQSMGFAMELTHRHYYDQDEAMFILGLHLKDRSVIQHDAGDAQFEHRHPVQFTSVFEIAETDGAYSFGWQEKGRKLFTLSDVEVGLAEVKKQQGRAVFLSFPSDYSGIGEILFSASFQHSGVLDDYFDDGIHEQHYTYYFPKELLLEHD